MSLSLARPTFCSAAPAAVRALLVPLLALASLTAAVPHAAAQDNSPPAPTIQVMHRPPEAAQLPVPGALMALSLELANSKDIETKVRLVGSRDGRFMDIAFPLGTLNNADRAQFALSVPAPLGVMTYQFIVHQPNGSLTTSARYIIKRPCIQNFRVEVAPDDPNAAVKQQLGTMIAKSKSLERETHNLDGALKILEDLSVSLKQ